jgi:hypothetical protein
MGTTSLAIWNMKKIVIAMATSAWGAGFIFQIQSKPLPPFGGSSEPHSSFKRAMVLAIVRVNNQPEL